jgi:hypothetical protein
LSGGVIEMTAFEAACQLWAEGYIPVLERWGFKVTEVPRELPPYFLGEKRWDIERGEKTKATIIIYAFRWEKESTHINFAPVCSWDIYQNALLGARRAFDEIIARLVVSATIRRHVRYKPYFIRKLGGKEVQFQFIFEKNEWRWLAWVFENCSWSDKSYEFAGTPEIDPIAAFKQFEQAVCLDLFI